MNAVELQSQVSDLTVALQITKQTLADTRARAEGAERSGDAARAALEHCRARRTQLLDGFDKYRTEFHLLQVVAEAAAELALTEEFPQTPAGQALLAALDAAA